MQNYECVYVSAPLTLRAFFNPPYTPAAAALTHTCRCCCMQIHEDHGRVRCLYRQYCMAGNTTHQKQLLALDIIRHSSMHSKKEDMVTAAGLESTQPCVCSSPASWRANINVDNFVTLSLPRQYTRIGQAQRCSGVVGRRDSAQTGSTCQAEHDLLLLQVLIPALAAYTGAQGAGLTEAQHQHLEVQLQELLQVPVTHPRYDTMMAQYMQVRERALRLHLPLLPPAPMQTVHPFPTLHTHHICAPASLLPHGPQCLHNIPTTYTVATFTSVQPRTWVISA